MPSGIDAVVTGVVTRAVERTLKKQWKKHWKNSGTSSVRFRSGQTDQTVNLAASAFEGSIPSLTTIP
jgi:hypothetical protein